MITSNKNYFISCLFFLFFFIGWGCCYPYLSLWLTETIGINYTDVGLVYSFTAIVAVCVQPLFGFISDKLVYRKNLMWMLAIIITLFAPYWIYVFAPLLKINVFLGALAGGLYIGMAYGAGCGVCEAYIDKVSRASGFEFGRARMFGGIGAAIGTFAAGKLYGIDQNICSGTRSTDSPKVLVHILTAYNVGRLNQNVTVLRHSVYHAGPQDWCLIFRLDWIGP